MCLIISKKEWGFKVNRHKKAGIPLDVRLRNYGSEDESETFHAMQQSLFLMAERLLDQDNGACSIIQDYLHWVSPIGSQLQVVCNPDFDKEDLQVSLSSTANVMTVWDFDGMGVAELNDLKKEIDDWLENPAFCFADQDKLDEAALTYQDEEVIAETKAFLKSIEEKERLDHQIKANQETDQSLNF